MSPVLTNTTASFGGFFNTTPYQGYSYPPPNITIPNSTTSHPTSTIIHHRHIRRDEPTLPEIESGTAQPDKRGLGLVITAIVFFILIVIFSALVLTCLKRPGLPLHVRLLEFRARLLMWWTARRAAKSNSPSRPSSPSPGGASAVAKLEANEHFQQLNELEDQTTAEILGCVRRRSSLKKETNIGKGMVTALRGLFSLDAFRKKQPVAAELEAAPPSEEQQANPGSEKQQDPKEQPITFPRRTTVGGGGGGGGGGNRSLTTLTLASITGNTASGATGIDFSD
ncbi:hypothetical protein B0H66DRAFT_532466 [Apodospora peruviana]|uniref:Uncharacterized protein n=1 Tax=Apodospora peruviana TaxID=516989 RepID=A0AAE0M431_9PEZI|nr:hypothetical protein B0H66DRAFT_532466 [Apodospora peruviana]